MAAVEHWVKFCGTGVGEPVFRSLFSMGRHSASTVRGVWRDRGKTWRAVDMEGVKPRSVGTYATEAEAIAALEAYLGKPAPRRSGDYICRDRRMGTNSVAQIVKARLRQLFRKKHH